MKKILFNQWNFIRFIRLGIGIAILVQAIQTENMVMFTLGLLFTAMPILNIGCCSIDGCKTITNKPSTTPNNYTFEEVVE
jgi:hypothetical protein